MADRHSPEEAREDPLTWALLVVFARAPRFEMIVFSRSFRSVLLPTIACADRSGAPSLDVKLWAQDEAGDFKSPPAP